MSCTRWFAWALASTLLLPMASSLPAVVAAEAPPPASRRVDFSQDIKPLLEGRCAKCHAHGQRKGGFSIESRETLLLGGESGPSVIAGNSKESYLIELVSAIDPQNIMPAEGQQLSAAEVGMLRAWIDQGIEWEEGFHFPRGPLAAMLAPRRVEIPPAVNGATDEHPLDRLLSAYFKQHDIQPKAVIDDRTYARRVYLDLIGLLPTPEAIEQFEADDRSDKRQLLAQRLLADRQRYADHWLTVWNDYLRNDYTGTGYIDGGRQQITAWLQQSLLDNVPYDQFVRQLVDPTPESAGFIKGIVWRGVVNASQTPPVQAAQNVSQIFLGINLKCASCHDSFINDWKLADAYGLAGVFADKELEMHRCDNPIGDLAPLKFLYPELGEIDTKAPRADRQRQLAEMLTSRQNGRFARTIVNRIWARLLGRGLVEPVDEMDNPPWNADLLDWLAEDFAEQGYDLKQLLERIVTSRAYQLPSVDSKTDGETDSKTDGETEGETASAAEFVFRGPIVRRMSAEQFVDAVSALTGTWQASIAAPMSVLSAATSDAPDASQSFRYRTGIVNGGEHAIDVDVAGARTLWLIVGEGAHGQHLDWAVWAEPTLHSASGTTKITDLSWRSATSGYGKPQVDKNVVEGPLKLARRDVPYGIGTHANSVIIYELPEGTTRFTASVGPDEGATSKSNVGHEMEFFVLTDVQARASLVAADPLMRALGRQNREQVLTNRPSAATTLEALELTNGATLSATLAAGAARWLQQNANAEPADLVTTIFHTALNRNPRGEELAAALELLGAEVTVDGVEDLLWSITMLPEFQLIY
jgi:hypothetical protein